MAAVILAIDPGETTGVCLIQTAPTNDGFEVLCCEEVAWNDRFQRLHGLILGSEELPAPQTLVMEAFRLRQGRAYEQSGSEMPSSQVIGVVEAIWWLHGHPMTEVTFQEPAAMARVQVLPEHVKWVTGSPHKQDAYRHARYYFLKHLYLPF